MVFLDWGIFDRFVIAIRGNGEDPWLPNWRAIGDFRRYLPAKYTFLGRAVSLAGASVLVYPDARCREEGMAADAAEFEFDCQPLPYLPEGPQPPSSNPVSNQRLAGSANEQASSGSG